MRARSRISAQLLFGQWLFALLAGCGPATSSSTPHDSGTETTSGTPSATTTDTTGTADASGTSSAAMTNTDTTPATPSDTSSSETTVAPGETSSADATSDTAPTAPVDEGKREFLSQTGLYADIATETLAPRVKEYQPQFQLWTDGAEKRRWIHIPEGTKINTDYMDEWQFPVGTKVWKEFSRDGVRIETRLIEKLPPERASEGFQGWLYMTYIWNDELTDAVATTEGLENAKGTAHDVPTQEMCGDCHDMRREKPLGVSAIQLSHSLPGATLDSLFDDGWLTSKPEAPLVVPGTEEQRQMLGYFHANCGHCHREGAPANNRVSTLKLWLDSDKLSSFEQTNAYVSLVDAFTESGQGSKFERRIVPGDPDSSEIMRRLLFRLEGDIAPVEGENGEPIEVPMPPLGTEVVDEPAVDRVRNWISSLSASE